MCDTNKTFRFSAFAVFFWVLCKSLHQFIEIKFGSCPIRIDIAHRERQRDDAKCKWTNQNKLTNVKYMKMQLPQFNSIVFLQLTHTHSRSLTPIHIPKLTQSVKFNKMWTISFHDRHLPLNHPPPPLACQRPLPSSIIQCQMVIWCGILAAKCQHFSHWPKMWCDCFIARNMNIAPSHRHWHRSQWIGRHQNQRLPSIRMSFGTKQRKTFRVAIRRSDAAEVAKMLTNNSSECRPNPG